MVKFILVMLSMSVTFTAYSAPLADPTAPLNFQPKQTSKVYRRALPTLQSIMMTAQKRQAIINNKAYQQGQHVSGYLITLIDAQKVLLRYQDKTYKLTLYSSDEQFSH